MSLAPDGLAVLPASLLIGCGSAEGCVTKAVVLRLSDGEPSDLGGEVQPLDTPLPRDVSVIVVLDLRTHGQRAMDRLGRWKARASRVAVLVVTDRSQRDLRRRTLELGVDDFILGPVDPEELELRLSRLRGGEPEPPISLQLQDCVVDLESRQIARVTGSERLSPTEARLLAYLAARPGSTIDHQTLLREVWGYDTKIKTRTLTVTIQRLRAKIEASPDRPHHLQTVYGAGYRFQPLERSKTARRPTLSWPSLLDSRRTNLAPQRGQLRGRDRELDELRAGLERSRWVRVDGEPGVGRRRLITEVLARQARRLPGGAFVIDASDRRRPWEEALAHALELSAGPVDPDRLGWALQARGPTWLGVVHPSQAAIEGLQRCLDRAPELRLVSTGPERCAPPDARPLRLLPLPEGQALRLLISAARTFSAGTALPGSESLRRLALLAEGLPARLTVFGPLLHTLGPADLADRIAAEGPWSPAWDMTPPPVRHLIRQVAATGHAVQASSLDAPAVLDEALRRGWLIASGETAGLREVSVIGAARPFLDALSDPPASLPGVDWRRAEPTWRRDLQSARQLLDRAPTEARTLALQALEATALDGHRKAYVHAAVLVASAQRVLGRPDAAWEVLTGALSEVDDLGLEPAALATASRQLAWVHADRCLPEAAEEALSHAIATDGPRDEDPRIRAAIARAQRRDAS